MDLPAGYYGRLRIPVVGYNVGAGRNDRAKALFLRLLTAEAIVGGAALLPPLRFGLDGVLYSMPVSDALTFVICLMVILYTLRMLGAGTDRSGKLCEN